MHSGLGALLRFIARNLLSLLAIACILALGGAAIKEWRTVQAARAELAALSSAELPTRAHAQQATGELSARIARYRSAPLDAIDAHIGALEVTAAAAARPPPVSLLGFQLPDGAGIATRVAAHYKQKIDLEIVRQELASLRQFRAYAVAGMDRERALAQLQALHAAHVEAYDHYAAHMQRIARLGWVERALIERPGLRTPYLEQLDNERLRLVAGNQHAWQEWQAQRAALARIDSALSAASAGLDPARIGAMLAPLERDIARAGALVRGSLFVRILQPVLDALPLAGTVLLMSFASHLLVKALFYYALAPLAARLAPIRLSDAPSGGIDAVPASAVSQQLSLAAGERLLVLPDYVQSAPAGGEKKTRWLLDWSCPWTSLISGMFALTSIRTGSAEALVLSASDDASSELSLVRLPAGAAMVFQPRCLVGVVYADATPLRITRHWRLGTLHAWLTLQLRYLVFHGPATLVLKGSRGVRVEAAGQGRLISQAATLGFSANLDYSTVRCDTFLPFYLGKSALLQDKFGGAGFYVYDETPRGGKSGNVLERGLEGLTDGILKVFGI